MNPIRYVFAISHPMQYMNALEFCYARNLPKEACAVLFFNKPYDVQIQQLQAVVNPRDWGHVQNIPYPKYWVAPGDKRTLGRKILVSLSKISSIWGFNKALQAFVKQHCSLPLEIIATGNYLSRPHRHFLALAEQKWGAKEIVLLDEGTSIPHVIVPLRHNPEVNKVKRLKGRFSKKDRAGQLMKLLTPLKYHHPKAVTFFTIYHDIQPPQTDTVEHNDFNRIKDKLQDFKTQNELWFIGTCFVEHNIATAGDYLNLLRTVKETFPEREIVYFPHRYETSQNLKNISALGIQIRRPDMALEPWILTQGKKPAAMAALASSAVSNIAKIFGREIPFTLFRPDRRFFRTEEEHTLWHNLIQDLAKESPSSIRIVEYLSSDEGL